MTIIELSAKLNNLKNSFNVLHRTVPTYEGYEKEYAAKRNKEGHRDINEKIARQLGSLKEFIPGVEITLNEKRQKLKFPPTSDRESQIQTAYILLQSKPNAGQLMSAIDKALSVGRNTFVSVLLDYIKETPPSTFNDKEDQYYLDIIHKQEELHSELTGIASVDEDIKEVKAIAERMKNFEKIIQGDRFYYMFFSDQKMSEYDRKEAEEFLNSHPEIPLENRIGLANEMSRVNSQG